MIIKFKTKNVLMIVPGTEKSLIKMLAIITILGQCALEV